MQISTDLAAIRKEYRLQSLLEKDVDADPIKQFERWFQHALTSGIEEPNAMTLATSTTDGKPSARIVLLKGIKENGLVFFTNYESKKGNQIHDNPYACLVFLWKELERQVRIEGKVKKISEQESDEYFSSRPVESRIGALSSPQSKVIESREILDNNVTYFTNKYPSQNIPRPSNWGGYILCPTLIEFWQGRISRLHDRLQYTQNEVGQWKIERLAP
ncbi:MAG TPA: pyridoxamine 5'-phosphate oxidase [Ginsengibacter sp.]